MGNLLDLGLCGFSFLFSLQTRSDFIDTFPFYFDAEKIDDITSFPATGQSRVHMAFGGLPEQPLHRTSHQAGGNAVHTMGFIT